DSNRQVWAFCNDRRQWSNAREFHSLIRQRNLDAEKLGDLVSQHQYCFEETIVKTLNNFDRSAIQFDTDSPYWIIKNALLLARELDLSTELVVNAIVSGNVE
ncbi:unnamed protein product, partial [Ectocarpus sp. 12 AP-2014]